MKWIAIAVGVMVVVILGLAWEVRKQGFLPYPATPISISIQQNINMTETVNAYGVVDPKQSNRSSWVNLHGFNLPPAECENKVTHLSAVQNFRTVSCWNEQAGVPFFGSGIPSLSRTIFVEYWLSDRDPSKPNQGDVVYTIKAAYASYGACWLAAKRQNDDDYATYLANYRAKKLGDPNPVLSQQIQCSALKNPTN
jgi:hypothetical protein